jgi:hypothetical protein
MNANLKTTNKAENLKHELAQLAKVANDLYLAVYAATVNAPDSPEFRRLHFLNNELRVQLVHAKNELRSDPLDGCDGFGYPMS